MAPAVHVVMLVANRLRGDTRAKRMAVSLTQSGYRVTIVCLAEDRNRVEEWLDDVHVIRCPVEFVLAQAPVRRFRLPWEDGLLTYRSKHDHRIGWRRLRLAQWETEAHVGRLQRDSLTMRQRLTANARSAKQRWLDLPLANTRQMPGSPGGMTALYWTWRVPYLLVFHARRAWRKHETRGRIWMVQRLLELQVRMHDLRSQRLQRGAKSMADLLRRRYPWRRYAPDVKDLDIYLTPVLDELLPDIVHAHDVQTIGIAERYAARSHAAGHRVAWIYDAHEYVRGLAHLKEHVRKALLDLEREYIGRADAVLTVSEPVAQALKRDYRMERTPTVVLNAPPARDRFTPRTDGGGLREAVGVGDEVPLLVYSGKIHPARGIHTIVAALEFLPPEVHIALVARESSEYLEQVLTTARERGDGERVRIAPFVAAEEVVTYLSSATAGIRASVWTPNHEFALSNKFFEYLHAGLPLIVSNVGLMAEMTRALGAGEVFEPEDPRSFARAASKVVADPDRYRRPLEDDPTILHTFSWETQKKHLHALYAELCDAVEKTRVEARPIRTAPRA